MHILIANYHDTHNDTVLSYGLELSKATGADCTLLQVIARPGDRQQGHDVLQAMLTYAQAAGVKANAELRLGLPAEQIVHLANELASSLIVMAEGKPDTFFGQLLTPPSERVIANAACPVLLARSWNKLPRKLLVLHSGSESLRTIPLFVAHMGDLLATGAEITLLHIMSQMSASYQVSGWELEATAEQLIQTETQEGQWLQQAVEFFAGYKQLSIVPKVRHGRVIGEILDEIKVGGYDLVVLGQHGAGGWQDFLTDNFARQIINLSAEPLLVIPRRSE